MPFCNEAGVDIDVTETIRELEEEMLTAANNLEFEKAALLRDQVRELKRSLEGPPPEGMWVETEKRAGELSRTGQERHNETRLISFKMHTSNFREFSNSNI